MRIIFAIIFALALFMFPLKASAQVAGSCANGAVIINTGLGQLCTDPATMVGTILSWGIGVGGGIVLLVIFYAAFQITTAGGDPKKLQAGQELLTSAISGLIVIIFSITILNLIGISVLGLNPTDFHF
jgi:hypothetical protein